MQIVILDEYKQQSLIHELLFVHVSVNNQEDQYQLGKEDKGLINKVLGLEEVVMMMVSHLYAVEMLL